MARICMLLNNFEPPYGGPELQATKITLQLQSHGHEVIFMVKGSGKAAVFETVNGIEVYRLNRQGLGSVEAMYRLWQLRDRFDIIHVHGVGRLASVAVSFGRRYNKRVIIKVTTAGHIVKPLTKGWHSIVRRISPFSKRKVQLLQQAEAMIAISDEITAELQHHGFSDKKIARIPNGVDTVKFCPVGSEEKQQLRQHLRLPEDKMIFLFTGKITKRKGLDILIEAWFQAKDVHDKAILVLAGSGLGQSDSLEEWLTEYLHGEDDGNTIIRVGAVDNVHQYLAAADFFVFPSRREGLPNSLLEAMSSGLVCIASAIGGNIDLIIPEKTGILVHEESTGQWSEVIQQCVKQPGLSLGIAARHFVQEQYSIDVTVAKIEALYNQCSGYNEERSFK